MIKYKLKLLILLSLFIKIGFTYAYQELDRIVAIVNKDVITFSDLSEGVDKALLYFKENSINPPPEEIIEKKVVDKNARTKVLLNTEYIDECYNEVIQDIMLSEYVYIYFNTRWRTVNISTSSLTFKTSVNDRLIQYSLEMEYANQVINNIV